jgi:Uma2 family endonuclease
MVMAALRKARLEAKDGEELPSTPREVFDALPPLQGLRAEIINGRLIVSPVGTPEHARFALILYRALWPILDERQWDGFPGNVDVCIDGPRDPVEPDLVVAPADCPRWGERELLSSGLKMIAEVVSKSSVVDDREHKPEMYARGRVPVYVLIDPLAAPKAVSVFSDPDEDRYRACTTVTMGDKLPLPAPIDFVLDTSIFL